MSDSVRRFLKKSLFIQYVYTCFIKTVRKVIVFIVNCLPFNKHTILLRAFDGKQYSCNPKYIAEQLLKTNTNLRIIFVFNDIKKYCYLEDEGYELVKKGSLKYYFLYLTSGFVIFNDLFHMWLPKNRKSVFINTWHGGGAYKKVGISLSENKYYSERYMLSHQSDYMISSCREFTKLAMEAFGMKEEDILSIGMPRNDLFFENNGKVNFERKIKERYGVEKEKKIVIYAPTWRKSMENSLYDLDFRLLMDTLNEKFDGEWVVFFRGHYFHTDNENVNNEEFINVSDYDDMQELLVAADCLITDYSSSVWDFSFTGKPCFLYATDLDEYKQIVDFYYPIEKWPFSLATNNVEMVENIMNFDYKKYIENVKKHHVELGSYEDGHACEKVSKLIEEICSGSVDSNNRCRGR